ncbi:MAG: DUF2244 domain-containing protein [bacterium]
MISVDNDSENSTIVIRPNRSMNWQQNLYFLMLLLSVYTIINIFFWWRGFWPVLVFSGLEFLMVALCIYLVYKAQSEQTIISISEQLLTVEKGVIRAHSCAKFQRHWVKLEKRVVNTHVAWNLFIGSHGKWIEIGEKVTHKEREHLFEILKEKLA